MVSAKLFFASCVFLGCLLFLASTAVFGAGFPVVLTDSAKRKLRFESSPKRVACLAPYATETLVAFGRQDVLVGLTRQDLLANSGLRIKNLGNYFHPDMEAVVGCRPDLVIAAPSHEEALQRFEASDVKVMFMSVKKVEDAFRQMEDLGRLFDCEERAAEIVRLNCEQIDLAKARLKTVPPEKRKRVARVLAGENLMWPGNDSFLNEVIEAAGGLTPRSGKNGFAVLVSLEQWKRFNPQVVFGCHENEEKVRALLNRDGWNGVDALKNGSVLMFPCDLTCRASVRVGHFVQRLATVLYMPLFADSENAVLKNAVLTRSAVSLDCDFADAGQRPSHVQGFGRLRGTRNHQHDCSDQPEIDRRRHGQGGHYRHGGQDRRSSGPGYPQHLHPSGASRHRHGHGQHRRNSRRGADRRFYGRPRQNRRTGRQGGLRRSRRSRFQAKRNPAGQERFSKAARAQNRSRKTCANLCRRIRSEKFGIRAGTLAFDSLLRLLYGVRPGDQRRIPERGDQGLVLFRQRLRNRRRQDFGTGSDVNFVEKERADELPVVLYKAFAALATGFQAKSDERKDQ